MICPGLEGGGNKTRKLEFLVGDALQQGADMLVTVGAIQSNHTRQTADPVYEGRAIRGLLNLADEGRFEKDAKVLFMHLGGSPAIHAYAGHFDTVHLQAFNA